MPEPGELLQLRPDIPNGPKVCLMFHPKYDALFVRDCYPRVFDVLMEDDTPVAYVGRWPAFVFTRCGGSCLSNGKGTTQNEVGYSAGRTHLH